jgi:hypothetical protein
MVTTTSPKRYSRQDAQAILAKFQEYSFDALHSMFKEGKAPTFEEIEGDTAGSVVVWNPKTPRWRRFFLRISLDNLLAHWAGKRFMSTFDQGKRGRAKLLFRSRFMSSAISFDTYIKKALFDQAPCLAADYCHFPVSVIGMVDDLRRIDDGILLGQNYHKLPWDKEHTFAFYFVLCALKKAD